MKHQINYSPVALQVISELTPISNKVLWQRSDDKQFVEVKNADDSKSVCYYFKAPNSCFDFAGEKCAFHQYSDFYNLFNNLENPTISQDDYQVEIASGKAKINYRLANPEVIKAPFNQISFTNADASFKLSSDNLKRLRGLSGLNNIDADRISFEFDDGKVVTKLFSTRHENTFMDEIEAQTNDEKFSIRIDTKAFAKIPQADYKVEVMSAGLMKFSMVREDDIVVELYLADIEE